MDTHRSKKRKRTNTPVGTSRACPPPATLRAKKDGRQRSCVACGVSVRGGIAGWAAGTARCVECGEEYHLGCVDPSVPCVRRAGWVCGVCSSNDHHRSRGERSAAAEAAAQLPASQQQRQQQQQEGVDAPPSRVVHVLSSALTRLSSLPDGGGGGSSGGGGKVTAGPRAPNGMNPTAAAAAAAAAAATVAAEAATAAATAAAAAATTATAAAVVATAVAAAATATTRGGESSSGSWNRKRGDTVTTTDSVLAWALRSIGGNGDEGTKRNLVGVGDSSSCGSSGAGGGGGGGGGGGDSCRSVIYEKAKGDGGGPNSRLLPREREGVNRSGRGGSNGDGGDVTGSGDGAIDPRDDGSSRKRSLGAREDREEEGEKPGFWDKDENTRFLQGVTKHGGAWARLAQKHAELGVVAVEESEGEDGAHASLRNHDDNAHVDDGRDSDGGGGDKPGTSLAGPAGEGTKQPGKKARTGGHRGSKQGKEKKKQKSRRGSSEWDDEEHERFVEGFERNGKAWAEVAKVVRTRDEDQVQRYSTRWVNPTGGLHESFRKIGEWEDDEHDRFMEGVKLYGRSWVDVASVVRTRTNRQVIMHAMHRLNDDLSSKPSLRACTSTGPQATDRAPPPAQPRAAVKGGDWGDDEHEAFMKGVKIYGRSWVSVARLMGTRTNEQVRAHAKQYLNKDLTEKRPWRSKSMSTTPPAAKAPAPCRKVAAAASPAPGVGVASAPAGLGPSPVLARPARRKTAAAAAARIESTTAGGDADGGGDGEWCCDAADAGHEWSSVVADGSESASESKAREETRPPFEGTKEEAEEGGRWSKRARLPGEVGGGAHEEGHTQDRRAGKKKKAKNKKKKQDVRVVDIDRCPERGDDRGDWAVKDIRVASPSKSGGGGGGEGHAPPGNNSNNSKEVDPVRLATPSKARATVA